MKIFTVFNYLFLILLAVSCLLPMLNQLAISFSFLFRHKAAHQRRGVFVAEGFYTGFVQVYGG